jgi:hypothetical protein
MIGLWDCSLLTNSDGYRFFSIGVLYLYTKLGLLIMSLGICLQILTYSLVKSRNLLKLSDRRIFFFIPMLLLWDAYCYVMTRMIGLLMYCRRFPKTGTLYTEWSMLVSYTSLQDRTIKNRASRVGCTISLSYTGWFMTYGETARDDFLRLCDQNFI